MGQTVWPLDKIIFVGTGLLCLLEDNYQMQIEFSLSNWKKEVSILGGFAVAKAAILSK